MIEQQILDVIGLSDYDLRAYLTKLDDFFEKLTSNEKKLFLTSMATLEDAVPFFKGKVTAKELENFIRAREPANATAVFTIQCCDDAGKTYRRVPAKPKKKPAKGPAKKPIRRPTKKNKK